MEQCGDIKAQSPTMRSIKKINKIINQVLLYIAGISLTVSMLLIVLNGFSRIVYVPFGGMVELVGWFAAITTTFSLGSAQLNRSNASFDLLTDKFSPRWKKITNFGTMFISFSFFIILAWQMLRYGFNTRLQGVLSVTLHVPFYPLILLTVFGFLGLILTLIIQAIESFSREGHQKYGS